MIFTRQVRHALLWLLAFLRGQQGNLERKFLVWPCRSAHYSFRLDASPWGIGGILVVDGTPSEWFADKVQNGDLKALKANRGESAYNTLWEAPAMLVAMRLWAHKVPAGSMCFEVRSDSLAALRAFVKMASTSPTLSVILQELALDLALADMERPSIWAHVPGVANIEPDALSRMYAPEAKLLPACLTDVPEIEVPVRDARFWRTLATP